MLFCKVDMTVTVVLRESPRRKYPVICFCQLYVHDTKVTYNSYNEDIPTDKIYNALFQLPNLSRRVNELLQPSNNNIAPLGILSWASLLQNEPR